MSKLLRIIICLTWLISCATTHSLAAQYDPVIFKEFNPDIQKYEFVNDYISALTYLRLNYERKGDFSGINEENAATYLNREADRVIGNLLKDNMNLRVAENYLKKYSKSQNGLVLKVYDTFVEACDKMIEFNEQEKKLIESYQEFNKNQQPLMFNRVRFVKDWQGLATQRKEASKKVLEASLLIGKVLISTQAYARGELVRLAITREQRKRLLEKLDVFTGRNYRGKLRSGQSPLEGSVASIREILEDKSWKNLDG